ncbi:MAG: DUF128 domain-containing protein [Methanomicrobiales archaeon]|nr:DUF128 domain-containing protein [Methanomicrobiales archaeon]
MQQALKFVNHNIEDYALKITFDPSACRGDVVINLSLVKNEDFEYAVAILKDAFRSGVSVSGLVRFFQSGEKVGDYTIPEGCTGICTLCSITFDGLLIRRGIPVSPIGGGIVQIENRVPLRFIHMILYEHTTIDPLQVLISQTLTSVKGVIRQGTGNILANIREIHMEAEPLVGEVLDELADSSYTGILDVGIPNLPVLGVPVNSQYVGIAVVGGTNPMAALRESGRWVQTQAMKGLMDVKDMDEIRSF